MTDDHVTKEEFNSWKNNHFHTFLVDFAVVKSQVEDHRKLLWIILTGLTAVLLKLYII